MNGNPPSADPIGPPICPLAVHGDRAEFHMHKYMEKITAHPGDAGIDLFPNGVTTNELNLPLCDVITAHTGVHFTPVHGTFAWIIERSSSVIKLGGARVIPAIIDAGYAGEMKVRIQVPKGGTPGVEALIRAYASQNLAIAQLLIIPHFFPEFIKYDKEFFAPLGRTTNGFGSTDKPIGPNIVAPKFS